MREMVTPDLSGPVPIARVAGEVDLANAARLRQELLALVTDEVAGLVVDVTDVPYADSAVIRVLSDLARDLRQRDQSLALTLPLSSMLRPLLKVTDFQEVAPICDDVQTAVQLISKGEEEKAKS